MLPNKINDTKPAELYGISEPVKFNLEHYVNSSKQVRNQHHFTHFEKTQREDSTESYRKNRSFFDPQLYPNRPKTPLSAEKELARSKTPSTKEKPSEKNSLINKRVTAKVGAKEYSTSPQRVKTQNSLAGKKEENKSSITPRSTMKPQTIMDGTGVSNSTMGKYIKDAKLFSKENELAREAEGTKKEVAKSPVKKQKEKAKDPILSYILSSKVKGLKQSVINKAEYDRKTRQENRKTSASGPPTNDATRVEDDYGSYSSHVGRGGSGKGKEVKKVRISESYIDRKEKRPIEAQNL